jgi:hypothetical protein
MTSGAGNSGQNNAQQQKLETARHDQQTLDLISKIESDELTDMEKLQAIANDYHTVAQLWLQQGDIQMAQKAQASEQNTLGLLDRLAKLEGTSETEAQMLLDEIKRLLTK